MMKYNKLVLKQPTKWVRNGPNHIENVSTNNVIRNPPKTKSLTWSSPLSSSLNIKPKIIIPQRHLVGYVDLANEVGSEKILKSKFVSNLYLFYKV